MAVVGSPSDPFLELLPTTSAVVRAEEGMVVASPSDPFLQQLVSQIFLFNCEFYIFGPTTNVADSDPRSELFHPGFPVKKAPDPGSKQRI